ncbi:MAG TPA: energy transducer TonB, partial [Chthoniobacterales bacterium]|nr:energy transducer TonB [Chthoniobacterales bacterium]
TTGPDALVNRIDAQALRKKQQKDGAVKFAATVSPDGSAGEYWTYHAMPGCEELDKELLRALGQAKFTPPIYNHQPVTVVLYGTLVWDLEDPPHVRVLLNQDPEEIKAASDFIGPQPVMGGDSKFKGMNLPEALPVAIEGIVDVALDVDEKGHLRGFQVLVEDPPLLGFGEAVIEDFGGAKFIPAFRDGDPEASVSVMSVCYKPIGVAPAVEGLELPLATPAPSP